MQQAVKQQVKRADTDHKRNLEGHLTLHKWKLTKTFIQRGKFPKGLTQKVGRLKYDKDTGEHHFKNTSTSRRQHGNFHSYVKRASRIMQKPAILRQLRNSGKILEQSIQKELVKFRR
jgi:hypothetical protein